MTICQERVQVIYQRGTRVRTHVNRSDADAVQLRAVRGDGTDAQIIWEVVHRLDGAFGLRLGTLDVSEAVILNRDGLNALLEEGGKY